jgi:hypothetical protein
MDPRLSPRFACGLAAAVATGLCAIPRPARAADELPGAPATKSEVREGVGGEKPAEAAEQKEGERNEGEEKEEERLELGLDVVLGWGKVPFAVETPAVSGNPSPTYTRQDAVPSNVQSLLLGGSLEVVEHVAVGARIPFTFARFDPDGAASRGAQGLGNLELEGEYAMEARHGLKLYGALGVALPTASGDEIPDTLANTSAVLVDAPSYDRFSLSRAAASARGYEDNALFEPHRLGIVPKVGAVYRFSGVSIAPYIKVENLVATTSLANSYVGELVAAVRVGYEFRRLFEVAVKAWLNAGFAGADEDKTVSAAVEPEVVLRFGPVRPFAGAIIPFAGPPSDNGFVGVRLGVGAAF